MHRGYCHAKLAMPRVPLHVLIAVTPAVIAAAALWLICSIMCGHGWSGLRSVAVSVVKAEHNLVVSARSWLKRNYGQPQPEEPVKITYGGGYGGTFSMLGDNWSSGSGGYGARYQPESHKSKYRKELKNMPTVVDKWDDMLLIPCFEANPRTLLNDLGSVPVFRPQQSDRRLLLEVQPHNLQPHSLWPLPSALRPPPSALRPLPSALSPSPPKTDRPTDRPTDLPTYPPTDRPTDLPP